MALLTGWNENEGLLFGPVKNAADFTKDADKYGSDAQVFLSYYPATSDSIAAVSQLNLSRDMVFGMHNYTWANVAGSQGNKVYVYRFTRRVPGTGEYAKYGAFHTGEVPYAYDNLKFVNRPWTDIDDKLANAMSNYWANFIKTGNPNGTNLPEWKAYHADDKSVMTLGDAQQSQPLQNYKQLDFLYEKTKSQ